MGGVLIVTVGRISFEKGQDMIAEIARLVSVGRVTQQKGFDLVPEIAQKVANHEIRFEWDVIGGASEDVMNAHRALVREAGLEGIVKFLGEMENPMPYVAAADIVVIPSRFEGWGMTLSEALVLGKPVVATDLPVFREQVSDCVNGLLVPLDAKAFADAIIRLFHDDELLKRLSREAAKYPFSKEKVLNEFESAITPPHTNTLPPRCKLDATRPCVRDASIEAYRVFLMFLICLLHSTTQGIVPNLYVRSGLLWAVPGFVFISGWFGIGFKLSKLIRLFMTGVVCGGIVIGIAYFVGMPLRVENIVQMTMRQWFLCCYMVLMLLAPLLNIAMENIRFMRGGIIGIIVLATWNWLSTSSIVHDYGPVVDGFGDYTFVMMLLVYVSAKLLRRSCDNNNASFAAFFDKWLTALLLAALAICVVGWRFHLGEYSSPFAIATAAFAFLFFQRIKLPSFAPKAVFFLAPSMFPVYLLHTNAVGFTAIKRFQEGLSEYGIPAFLLIPITAIAVFVSCICLDLIRRGIGRLLNPVMKRLWHRIDNQCERLDFRIASWMNG